MSEFKCEECNDTGFYGDNGPGKRNNADYQRCDRCDIHTYAMRGFAPDDYHCVCNVCKEVFIGDKRAFKCKRCARKELDEYSFKPKNPDCDCPHCGEPAKRHYYHECTVCGKRSGEFADKPRAFGRLSDRIKELELENSILRNELSSRSAISDARLCYGNPFEYKHADKKLLEEIDK